MKRFLWQGLKKGEWALIKELHSVWEDTFLHLVDKKNIDISGVFLFETLVAAPDTPNHIFFICLEID